MTALRTIQRWLPALQRSCTAICPLHRPTTARFLPVRPFVLSAARGRNTDEVSKGRYTASTEEEEEDFIDDSEVEELFQQQDIAEVGQGQHRLFIVHPDVKWGSRKQHLTTGELHVSPALSTGCKYLTPPSSGWKYNTVWKHEGSTRRSIMVRGQISGLVSDMMDFCLQLSWCWLRLWDLWTLWTTGQWWTALSSPPRRQRRRGYLAKATFSLLQVSSVWFTGFRWETGAFERVFAVSSIRENSPNGRNHSCVCQRRAPVSFVRGGFLCRVPSGCIQKAFLHQLSLLPVQKELKEAWGVNVFDRYSVVLHIFRCNAKTKEAKLQISLAEIPLLR